MHPPPGGSAAADPVGAPPVRSADAPDDAPTAARLDYRPELDGLRGVAIGLVILTHFYLPGTDALGWMGVQVFFVLSGFLITSLLVAEREATGSIDLRGFYVRRIRRLAPALLVVVAIGAAFDASVLREDPIPKVGWVISYLANWKIAAGGYLGPLSHAWSLAIEEQFYLVWPGLLLVALRLGGRRTALALAIVAALASVAWRLALWWMGAGMHRAYFATDARIDAVMIGAAIALLAPRWAPGWRSMAIAATVIVAAASLPVDGHEPFMLGPGLVGTALATGVLLLARSGPLRFPPLVSLGRLSYSLYLWHYPVMAGVHKIAGTVPPWTVPLAFALAWLSYRFVERPFRERSGARQVSPARETDGLDAERNATRSARAAARGGGPAA